jgi:hypothetical protein
MEILPFEELPAEELLLKQVMLTSQIIWKGEQLSRRDLDEWLHNFTGEVFSLEYERKLALWLLSNFVYYNSDEVKHLCRLLYRDFVHDMLLRTEYRLLEPLIAAKEALKSTRFYCLGRPGESGAYILYYFRQENNLPLTHFISDPDKLEDTVKYIVFIDDVVLSGTQADKYLKKIIPELSEGKEVILLTFVSTSEAMQLLSANNIKVISNISLDERSRCFSESSAVFNDFKNHRENCQKLSTYYGEKIAPGLPLGYKDGQYTFGFFYNTPDNTLPIFWSQRSGWKPIVKRYDKKYKGEAANDLGKFI